MFVAIFHGREGVGHDESSSSSPVGRCLIRNRPWLWLTDKVIITPLDNTSRSVIFLRFDEFLISDFYDFTPKYIITKLMYVYKGLQISQTQCIWKSFTSISYTVRFHKRPSQNDILMKPILHTLVPMKIITVGHFFSVGDFRLVIFLVWYLSFVMHFIVVDISAMSNTQRGMVLTFTTVDVVERGD